MASDVDICNMALSLLGRETISIIGESSPEGKACATFYAQSRDEALRDHPWNFAQTRRALAPVAVPKGYATKWVFGYSYPGDCLHGRELSDGVNNNLAFEVAQDDAGDLIILTNAQPAYLSYSKVTTDTSKFDAGFVGALALKIAANLAIPLTKNPQTEQSMLTKYINTLPVAKTADAKEGHKDKVDDIPWLVARTGALRS